MAKSSTKRKSKAKSNLTPERLAEVEQGIAQAVRYIDDWKRREIANLATKQQTDIPICVPIKKDAYLVGKYGVKRVNKIWHVIDSVTEKEEYFSRRSSAVAYALCIQTRHIKLAKEILTHDSDVIRLSEHLDVYKLKANRARSKKDYWRVDHFNILASRAEYQLEDAKNQLEKSMDLAKYFKIWE